MKTTSTASFAMAAAVLALSAASAFAANPPKGSSGKAIAANDISASGRNIGTPKPKARWRGRLVLR